HQKTRSAVMGERAFSNRLEGGCQVPIAALGKIEKNIFTMSGLVADIDGKILIKKTLSGPVEQSETIGVELADSLLSMGAKKILENIKAEINENYER
ncbi:MAG: hydroxymethylbilane synthase, partial [Proteobacteria bacterium]|nr:hydroxymethylbilane synthase [Pseudomonadota bacterium]